MQLSRFVFICAASVLLVLASGSYAADTPAEATANPTPEAATNPPAEVAANPSAEAANPPMTTNAPPKSTSQTAMAGTAVASNPPVVTEPGRVFLIRDSAFFQMHIEKAVNYALKAEIAGNRGDSEVLQQHARTSLIQAREAQRAGNVAGLDEGIANLKRALSPSIWSTPAAMQASSAEMPRASTQTSAAEMPQASTQTSSPQITGEKPLSETQRSDAALRSAIDAVREARKNLHQAQGTKLTPVEQFQNVAAY
ncbi:MAG TPA: hypothetical protein VKB81_14200 [Nitrospira sp.]|nr:hypothetical protein [Nitrospira sp.]